MLRKDEKREIEKALEHQRTQSGQRAETQARTQNSFDGSSTGHGAVLVAYDGSIPGAWCSITVSGYCHAGIWDRNRYNRSISSPAIRTANTDLGVKWESPEYWRKFLYVREMVVWVTSEAKRAAAVTKAASYSGPYSIFTSKSSNNAWYCSKVVWRAFWDATSWDLDGDGGFWVFPGDIRWSPWTRTVKVWY